MEDVAGEGFVGEPGGLAGLGAGQAFAFAREDELLIVNEGYAVGGGELLGAGTDEIDVGTLFEDEARGPDGVAEALDTGHSAGFHAAAVHEECIELDTAVGGEETAPASVERRIVFEDDDGGFNGVEGGSAAGENGVTGLEGVAHAGLVSGCVGGRNGPCAAMDEEGWDVCGWGFHLPILDH